MPNNLSKPVFLAIEVWVDVLGFILRIQLARTISLTNCHIHQICWPRMHGDKVAVHEVRGINIISRERFERGRPPKALVLKDGKLMSLPSCPPPSYISGFEDIIIEFLDDQVLAFFTHIASCISAAEVQIYLLGRKKFDEQQLLSVNRLIKTFPTYNNLLIQCAVGNIKCLQDVEDKMLVNYLGIDEEADIPILIEFLASPRSDGQQRVVFLYFDKKDLEQKLLATIKMDFHGSTQLVPQPFYLQYYRMNLTAGLGCVEENQLTNETLTIGTTDLHTGYICRHPSHPKGQYELWAEDARKRLAEWPPKGGGITFTFIDVQF